MCVVFPVVLCAWVGVCVCVMRRMITQVQQDLENDEEEEDEAAEGEEPWREEEEEEEEDEPKAAAKKQGRGRPLERSRSLRRSRAPGRHVSFAKEGGGAAPASSAASSASRPTPLAAAAVTPSPILRRTAAGSDRSRPPTPPAAAGTPAAFTTRRPAPLAVPKSQAIRPRRAGEGDLQALSTDDWWSPPATPGPSQPYNMALNGSASRRSTTTQRIPSEYLGNDGNYAMVLSSGDRGVPDDDQVTDPGTGDGAVVRSRSRSPARSPSPSILASRRGRPAPPLELPGRADLQEAFMRGAAAKELAAANATAAAFRRRRTREHDESWECQPEEGAEVQKEEEEWWEEEQVEAEAEVPEEETERRTPQEEVPLRL